MASTPGRRSRRRAGAGGRAGGRRGRGRCRRLRLPLRVATLDVGGRALEPRELLVHPIHRELLRVGSRARLLGCGFRGGEGVLRLRREAHPLGLGGAGVGGEGLRHLLVVNGLGEQSGCRRADAVGDAEASEESVGVGRRAEQEAESHVAAAGARDLGDEETDALLRLGGALLRRRRLSAEPLELRGRLLEGRLRDRVVFAALERLTVQFGRLGLEAEQQPLDLFDLRRRRRLALAGLLDLVPGRVVDLLEGRRRGGVREREKQGRGNPGRHRAPRRSVARHPLEP